MSGHEGTASGQVVAVQEATDQEIVYVPIKKIRLRGPLTIVPVRLRLRRCEFPAPEVDWFQVYLNERLVTERRFRVLGNRGEVNGQSTS